MRRGFALRTLCVMCVLATCAAAAPRARGTRVVLDSDGWQIVGDLVVPRAKRAVPAVILLNKAAGNRKAYEGLARRLAELGIASLRVDLRGHGESVNKGVFDPNAPPEKRFPLGDEENDICAAFRYLKTVRGVDGNRVGFVGASYSGEEMMECARKQGHGKAYVALSPGSFSEESMAGIDSSGVPWLIVKSVDERARVFKDFFALLRQKSRTVQVLEMNGGEHATDILGAHPELVDMVAVWFKYKLG
jgi:dienelactone hydrolase